jgi:hypothetical protein
MSGVVMSTNLEPIGEIHLVRPLTALISLIAEEITEALQAGMRHYAIAGYLLHEAKQHFPGDLYGFYKWATERFNCSQTSIKDWMKYAVDANGGKPLIFLPVTKQRPAAIWQPQHSKTLSEVVYPNRTTHQPAWHEPVKEAIDKLNLERMVQEQQAKDKELRLQRELGMRLIDIGFNALAAKLHPDMGGSDDAMARLNKVRRILKGALP